MDIVLSCTAEEIKLQEVFLSNTLSGMLRFSQMSSLCDEIQISLLEKEVARFYSIAEKKWLLCFANSPSILFCLQRPFVRFHLTTKGYAEKKESFAQSVEESLRGMHLKNAALVKHDRILQLAFANGDKTLALVAVFIPGQENLFLLDAKNTVLASAFANTSYPPSSSKGFAKDEKTVCTSAELERITDAKEREFFFGQQKAHIEKGLRKALQKALGRKALFLQEIEQGEKWKLLQHDAELLQAYFYLWKKGMHELVVEDWELQGQKRAIALDVSLELSEEIKKRFRYAGKCKRKEQAAHELLKITNDEVNKLNEKLAVLERAQNIEDLTPFITPKSSRAAKEHKKKEHPFREFTTESGCKIFVGKNDLDNEKLTFSFANGLDIWLHVSDFSGSHVILQAKKGVTIDADALQDAACLAVHFSKAKGEKIADVTYTECKHVQRIKKGKRGQVAVSVHKKLQIKSCEKRLKRLFSKLL